MEKKVIHNTLVRLATIESKLKVKEVELNKAVNEADDYGLTNNVYRKENEEPKPVRVEIFERHQVLLQNKLKLEFELHKLLDEKKSLSKRIIESIKATNGNILETSIPEGTYPKEVISASLEGDDLKITVTKK